MGIGSDADHLQNVKQGQSHIQRSNSKSWIHLPFARLITPGLFCATIDLQMTFIGFGSLQRASLDRWFERSGWEPLLPVLVADGMDWAI